MPSKSSLLWINFSGASAMTHVPFSDLVKGYGRRSALGVLFALGLLYLTLSMHRRRKRLPLPPGPRGLPLIGNIRQMSPSRPWVWFHKLGQEDNSPLVYLNLAGRDIVVINDYQTAVDLLEKRSAKYSSRPHQVVPSDYVAAGRRFVFLPCGNTWRRLRAAFQRDLTPQKSLSYSPIQVAEAKILRRELLQNPSGFMDPLTQYAASVVLKIVCGLNSEGGHQKVIADFRDVVENLRETARPGAYLVNSFPSLDRLPDFLSPWRAAALLQQENNKRLFNRLLNDAREKVIRGELSADATFATRIWEDRDRLQLDELDVAYLAGTMFDAGTTSTAASLSTFVLASVAYPAAYKTGQAEVDQVFGDHPPTLDDLEQCEYIRAMCK